MGKTVELNYTWQYGNSYSPSSELQALVNGWYNNGTEVIFCCGGNMYQSVAQAAAENDGYMVGVDTDQSPLSETIITSAMKGLKEATVSALGKFFDGTWADIGGKVETLNLQAGDYVGLPTAEASWGFKTFTMDEYNTVLEKIRNGEIKVDNTSDDATKPTTSSNITVDYQV